MRNAILILFLFSGILVSAQREAANWYFGNFAGLDFNSGEPVPLLDGQLRTVEGSASFSTAEGDLLFYTEGVTVWDRFHQVMPNGTDLLGSFSTTQSSLIVPNPIRNNLFYIFTPDDALVHLDGGSNGFNYSTVDINQNGGRGDVTDKNIELLSDGSEKVTAVRSSNGDFFWVITHFQNQFFAYRVDGNGVNQTPVISTTGPFIEGFDNIRGALKASPDGNTLAVAHTIVEPDFVSSLFVFDFDSETGVVSNPTDLGDESLYYGIEFSPTSSKLYASGIRIASVEGEQELVGREIVQFDLADAENPTFSGVVHRFISLNGQNSGIILAGALQLAIDGKIYHSGQGNALSVINSPNQALPTTDFRPFAIDLGGRTTTFGLPPFIQSLFESIVLVENLCEGDSTEFTVESDNAIRSVSWDFGDPATGPLNFSNDLNPNHVFSESGDYIVTITVDFEEGPTRVFTEFIEIVSIPDVPPQVVLVQCDIDGQDDGISRFNLSEALELYALEEGLGILFFENQEDAIANVNNLESLVYQNVEADQILYVRIFDNPTCFALSEVVLETSFGTDLGTVETLPICLDRTANTGFSILRETIVNELDDFFANGEDLTLYLSEEAALLEVNELLDQEIRFSLNQEPALYFRVEENMECNAIGRIAFDVIFPPEFEPEVQTELCRGNAVLTAIGDFSSYVWSTGETTQEIVVEETGTFEVEFSNGICSYTQTFVVENSTTNSIADIEIVDFRVNNSITIRLENEETEVQYSIDEGLTFQSSNRFERLVPGIYDVLVETQCLTLTETVLVGGLDSFFTPNGDSANEIWSLENQEFFPNFSISVFNRFGQLLYRFGAGDSGWDGTFNQRRLPSDSYWYRLETEERTVTGSFALKR